MIIWGEQPDGSDHDEHLTEFLKVTRKYNLNLNKNRLQYKTKYANFFWTTFTPDSHKPKNEEAQAINKML